MPVLVVLAAIVPITIVSSLCLSNQSREFDDEGELQATNATGAKLALGVDMLSQVSLGHSTRVLPSCPSMFGKRAR